jgi:FAD/FMN-containing dehydrogenase
VNGLAEVVVCSQKEKPDIFKAVLCSLGALGIVTKLTLKLVPTFRLECHEKVMTFSDVMDQYSTLIKQNDFFRFWWIPHTEKCVVWRANKTFKET